MKTKDLRQNILHVLASSKHGLNLNSIVSALHCSRTTAMKYLHALKAENRIKDLELGHYHIWLYNESKTDFDFNRIFTIFNSLLKNLQGIAVSPAQVKDLGKLIAKDIDFSNDLPTEVTSQSKAPNSLTDIAELLKCVMDKMCKPYDDYEWEPSMIRSEKAEIILRLKGSKFIDTAPYYFYLLAGFFENELTRHISGTVNVLQISPSNKLVDFAFDFNDFPIHGL